MTAHHGQRGGAYLAALEGSLADFAGTDDFPDDVSAILLEYRGGKVAR